MSSDLRIENLIKSASFAYEKHVCDMKILESMGKLNRINVEKGKIKELIKADRSKISLIKHETELIILESKLELQRRDLELSKANYEFEIELPARLEADKVRSMTNSRVKRVELETDAQVYSMKVLGLARIAEETSCKLAEASGFTKLAIALNQYYKALIVDRIADYLLNMISRELNVDPSFRFKIERPISFLVKLVEQQPVTTSWKQKLLSLKIKKIKQKNRYILCSENMRDCCITVKHS